MPHCIYLRKSRADLEAESRGEGETLARHERALMELAGRLSIDVPPGHIYRELVSGDTLAERPVAQRLLREVEAGAWDGVLVMDIDRLARGETIDQGIVAQAFKYSGTRIVTPLKTYDPQDDLDEEFVEFSLFMARREYKMIKRRMQGGRVRSAGEGHYLGPRPPYGYVRVHERGGRGWTLDIAPDKAAIVRAVFGWYAHGLDGRPAGAQCIANRLNALGVRTDLGNPFDAPRIRSMLKNPTYIGLIQWNQRVTTVTVQGGTRTKRRLPSDAPMKVKGLHEPIIDRALWDAVQRRLNERGSRPVSGGRALANPLAGLVRCGHCGRGMVRKPGAKGRPDLIRCPNPDCDMPGCALALVEEAALAALGRWLGDYAPPAPAATQPPAADLRAPLDAELDRLRAQQNRLCELLERDVYSEDVFRARNVALQTRIEAAESALAMLDAPSHKPPDTPHQVQSVREIYSSAHVEMKNAILRATFSHIIYNKSKTCRRGENPASYLELAVFPRVASVSRGTIHGGNSSVTQMVDNGLSKPRQGGRSP